MDFLFYVISWAPALVLSGIWWLMVRYLRTGVVGTLRIDRSDGEEHMFLEIDKGQLQTIYKSKKIALRVLQENYLDN